MKIAVLTAEKRFRRFADPAMIPENAELVFFGADYTEDEVIARAGDAEVIMVDAVYPVTEKMIQGMPKLKLIHSEGVAYNRIDTEAAAKAGVYVCNNRAVNAGQVAEHTVLLMLAVMRRLTEGDAMIRAGRQGEAKYTFIQQELKDLIDQRVGLVGFGAIGRELAKRLLPFGCRLFYYDPFRADEATEREYNITYLEKDELLRTSDVITLHVPVTPSTTNFINRDTLALMKPSAILINCARGAVVNSADLAEAVKTGKIYGAGIDTIDPEPVSADDPLVCLPEPWCYRVILSPHIAGTTVSVFLSSYRNFFNAIAAVMAGEKPKNVVNGL